MMVGTIINIKDSNLQAVATTKVLENIDSTTCINSKATSVEIKCSLFSSLTNIKSIKDLVVSGSFSNFNPVDIKIDTDFVVDGSYLPKKLSRTIHLEGDLSLNLNGNFIESYNFVSTKILTLNKVESLIPPSSCFNLTLAETITEITIPFINEDQGMNLQGVITANVISVDYNEITPCL